MLHGHGCHGFNVFDLELNAMLMVVKPNAGGLHKLTGSDRRCIARHGHPFPLAFALYPYNKETGRFAMEGDSFYRPLQVNYGLMISLGMLSDG